MCTIHCVSAVARMKLFVKIIRGVCIVNYLHRWRMDHNNVAGLYIIF